MVAALVGATSKSDSKIKNPKKTVKNKSIIAENIRKSAKILVEAAIKKLVPPVQ